jgi:hypothetical protein
MKKVLLLAATWCFFVAHVSAQIAFEPGYFIDLKGKKTICLIKNKDKYDTPKQFDYKIGEKSPVQEGTINNVAEFGINTTTKYVRSVVQLDTRTDELSSLNHEKDPQFEEKTLFLEVLVDGAKPLYRFRDGHLERYFQRENGTIVQLIYKRYLNDHNQIYFNRTFHRQLIQYTACGQDSTKQVAGLEYTKEGLTKYFQQYHECAGLPYVTYTKATRNARLRVHLIGGADLNRGAVGTKNFSSVYDYSFAPTFSPRGAIQFELQLPINRKKWSVFIEPGYHTYESTEEEGTIKYRSLQFPLGGRHYFYLNAEHRFFAEGFFYFDQTFENKVGIKPLNLNIQTIPWTYNLGIGAGYNYKRWSVTARYYPPRNIASRDIDWKVTYQTFSFTTGFRLF